MVIEKWASGNNPISRSFFHSSQLGCVQILKSNIILFVMVCANSSAKDYLRSPSCDHKETTGRQFFYPFRLTSVFGLTGGLLLGAPWSFYPPIQQQKISSCLSWMREFNCAATRKCFVIFFFKSSPEDMLPLKIGEERERERKRNIVCEKETSIGCLFHKPNQRPNPQPRLVLGIEPMTFWFTG